MGGLNYEVQQNRMYRVFLSIWPPAYKTMVLYTGKNPIYKTMVLYCTIFLQLGIRVPNIQFLIDKIAVYSYIKSSYVPS